MVEFYAAWVPFASPKEYQDARRRVMRLLAGRKNCRDFIPSGSHPGLPKSSLDGMRDTVLRGPAKHEDPRTYRNAWSKATRRKLRVRTGEQLDVVGVVKRAGEGTRPYPSVSRVAVDPWVRGILKTGRQPQLDALKAACTDRDIVHRIDGSAFPQYREFDLEGTTLFRTRHREWFEETADAPGRPDERPKPPAWYPAVDAALRDVEAFAAEHKIGAEPNPYLAVIVADGDKMGETIGKLVSRDEHQSFSRELSRFATEADKIVRKHQGVLVYAGGDDVFAFAPVDRCLDCARSLHTAFGTLMKDLVAKLNAGRAERLDANMTLSVGVAIAHFMENLEDLRQFGRDAEKDAKTPDANGAKDSLAVHLHKRGGGPVKVRAKWADNPDARLEQYATWLQERRLPGRLATDLDRMVRVYQRWPAGTSEAAIEGDVLRVIRAKQPGGAGVTAKIETAIRGRVTDAASLRQLAEELLIARQIAAACRQANPDAKGGDE